MRACTPCTHSCWSIWQVIEDEEERGEVLRGNWFAQLPARQLYGTVPCPEAGGQALL